MRAPFLAALTYGRVPFPVYRASGVGHDRL